MKPAALAMLLLLAAAGTATADIVYLDGGGRVEGVVTIVGDSLIVKSIHGTARVPAARVLRRVERPYVTEIYEARRGRTDPADADAVFGLAAWCEKQGMRKQAREHFAEVLVLDPDHARARARQGLVKHEGIWMTPERAHGLRMTKEGFVRYDGRWFTPAGLKAYIRAKQAAAVLEEAMAKKREEREERERKRREAEETKRREEEARRRAEEDRRERERLQRERDRLVDVLRWMALHDAYRYRGSWIGWGGWYGGGCRPVPYRGYGYRPRGAAYGGGSSAGAFGTRPVGTGYGGPGRYTQGPFVNGRTR
ncbi:MAG: hypothetical protein ABFS86_11895 [Planctomycetota bacterium]